jgi:hypothetical protein
MIKEELVKAKREELKKQFDYCETLLGTLYHNFDKTKLRNEMAVMKKEIDTLTYVIDDEMPF